MDNDNDYSFWEDDYSDVVQPVDGQNEAALEPEYVESETGTKHEYNGTLLVPTEEETRRIEASRVNLSPIAIASPAVFLPDVRGHRFAKTRDDFKSVKLTGMQIFKMRSKDA